MDKWLWLAVAGTLGTWARYALGGLVAQKVGSGFPWGTVTVNLVGCLAFGLVGGVASSRTDLAPTIRLYVLIGFMGAFTTFSTFAYETKEMLTAGQWAYAAGYVLIHNVIGVAAMLLGLRVGGLI